MCVSLCWHKSRIIPNRSNAEAPPVPKNSRTEYIYIHIGNYNEQFIFPTSISYHFYKGFVGNVFWEAPLRQRAVRDRETSRLRKGFLSRSRGIGFFFFPISVPEEGRRCATLFYTHFSDSRECIYFDREFGLV